MSSSSDLRIHLPPGGTTAPHPGGEFVLYWMQTTHRAHDNFALNFAIEQANELGLPVLVYHGLRHDYPWASDRFHTWILESVVDLYAGFAARGIQYAFWLSREQGSFTAWPAGKRGAGADTGPPGPRDRPPGGPTALVSLADRAALVVTDHFPTFIVPRQTRGLRQKTATPVVAVESCTVVPMRAVEKAHSTARGIRPVLMSALEHFLYPVTNPEPRVRRRIDLPFDPVIPTPAGIPSLVSSCDIDHSVAPSRSFRGGTRAGRARLAEFLKQGLERYDQRNDPNEPGAVSRLSPWLHFGNLSPHEILLAVAGRTDGRPAQHPNAARFLDEALVWRELAHNFCHYDPKHRTAQAIPEWARKQLSDHEADPRPHLYSLEELEQARTGEELWNAAQRWYRHEGWMHNYMRMLWGKTVLQWTPNAAEALHVLEHLNNRYSLDGRDPNSYGGILWIFGKFDRPFYPRPIYGNVRYMSLKAARDKFDVGRYVTEAPQEAAERPSSIV